MTPSFLELVADATKIDSVLQKIMGVNMIQPVAEVAASGSNSNKAGVAHSSGGTTVNNAPKPSLMERNSSARTLQWDDSINGSQEDIACRVELRVPSQKRRNTSPLRIYEANDKKRRRPVRKWSLREEETLREAVEEAFDVWASCVEAAAVRSCALCAKMICAKKMIGRSEFWNPFSCRLHRRMAAGEECLPSL